MNIEELKKEALYKGYFLRKASAPIDKIIKAYDALKQPKTISQFATEIESTAQAVMRVLPEIGAMTIKSGRTIIIIPMVPKEETEKQIPGPVIRLTAKPPELKK